MPTPKRPTVAEIAAELLARSRAEQGLPLSIKDRRVLRRLAGIVQGDDEDWADDTAVEADDPDQGGPTS